MMGFGLLSGFSVNAQTYAPIPAIGFDYDVIAETSPAMNSTTTFLDGSDYVLYSVNYGDAMSTGLGLPNDGLIVNGSRSYQLQPFNQNNVVLLNTSQTDSIDLVTPASFASLSLLVFATEGQGGMLAIVKFTDGSASVNNVVVPDWFDENNTIISGIDRTGRTTNTPDFLNYAPNLFAVDIHFSCADRAKLVEEILLINTNPPSIRLAVFALSGVANLNATSAPVNVSCNGLDDGEITIAGTGGTPPYTYSWNTTPAQTTGTATGLAPGTYTAVVTDDSLCTYTTAAITITEPTVLTASATATPTICAGSHSGSATATAAGGTTPYDYAWNATPVQTAAMATNLPAGTYSVTVTDANDCEVTTLPLTIGEFAPVNVNVTAAGASFTAQATGSTFQWLNCDAAYAPIAGATSATYTATVTGHYAVKVTTGSCSDTSVCLAYSTLSVNENGKLNVSMYPNPAKELVTIHAEGTIVSVMITDLSGKIYAVELSGTKLNMKSLSAGSYLVRVTDEKGASTVLPLVKL